MLTEKSFKQIYDRHFEELCRFLSLYTQDRSTIEDIVQDIFVKLWNERETINILYIKTYLMHSARNRMLNSIRDSSSHRDKLSVWALNEHSHMQADDCIDMEEFFFMTQLAVEHLPQKCRQIFTMSRDEKLSYKEIAERLGISIKTVEAQMGIALRRVKEALSKYFAQEQDEGSRFKET